jgi:CheY-like chemotaxis protein
MGLGLAIVERACALLGHPLGLQSVVGRGTVFMVQVPLAEGALTLAPVEAPPPARHPAPERIALLVENDADLRRAMVLLLEKWGISALDAADGEEALALIDEIGILPDCLLVDHQLGEPAVRGPCARMTGLEFIRRMRASHGAVPARLITANRTTEVRSEAAAMGVEVMVKPIDARALEAFLNNLPPPR